MVQVGKVLSTPIFQFRPVDRLPSNIESEPDMDDRETIVHRNYNIVPWLVWDVISLRPGGIFVGIGALCTVMAVDGVVIAGLLTHVLGWGFLWLLFFLPQYEQFPLLLVGSCVSIKQSLDEYHT